MLRENGSNKRKAKGMNRRFIGDLIFNLVSNIEQMSKQLEDVSKAAKKTASRLSVMGVASRKAMLSMINSSVVAGAVMQDFNDIVGIIIYLGLATVLLRFFHI